LFEATLVDEFRRTDFRPVPRVEVVMLRLHKRGPPLVASEHAQVFRDFVIHAFTSRNASLNEDLARLIGTRRARRLSRHVGLESTIPTLLPPRQWIELFDAVMDVAPRDLEWRVAGAERHLRAA